MKENLNAIIDNVWAYTIVDGKLSQKGKNQPEEVIAVTEHRGSINRMNNIFKNEKGKKYSVAANPGEVKAGKIVWFNEPNFKEAILSFTSYEIDQLEKDFQKEERRKKKIRTLFAYAEHVNGERLTNPKLDYSELDKASYDK